MTFRKPPAIVMAPTANAAYIINGETIESALGMLPHRSNQLCKRKRDKLSNYTFLYNEDVTVIFCDEISMVGSMKLAKINYRLQDLAEGGDKHDFMGGISFVASGNFIHASFKTSNYC